MTEDSGTPAPMGLTAADMPRTAGALLRQARQAKGLHIAALAASLKVPQRKLEALEADRHEELLDATFARALAQTMCRSLKVDPAPVLALLPHAVEPPLDRVAQGLNQPFRERPGREEPKTWAWLQRPGPLAAMALLIAAGAVYLAPSSLWSGLGLGDGLNSPSAAASEPVFPPATASSGVSLGEPAVELQPAPPAAAPTPAGLVAAMASTPLQAAVSTANAAPSAVTTTAPAAGSGPLRLSARAQTWVEVRDANDQMLANRTLESGEQLVLDGAVPFKIRIGNAAGAEVQFRGQPVDLSTRAINNVARFELK